ncbi:hypothetical protein BX600DRAFT_537538 [Xylariales sp. PMI_506]|nr:hypothetical protein BX600DRAFT_537538 [Xylariales sp. PMI_506]
MGCEELTGSAVRGGSSVMKQVQQGKGGHRTPALIKLVGLRDKDLQRCIYQVTTTITYRGSLEHGAILPEPRVTPLKKPPHALGFRQGVRKDSTLLRVKTIPIRVVASHHARTDQGLPGSSSIQSATRGDDRGRPSATLHTVSLQFRDRYRNSSVPSRCLTVLFCLIHTASKSLHKLSALQALSALSSRRHPPITAALNNLDSETRILDRGSQNAKLEILRKRQPVAASSKSPPAE